MKCVLIIPSWRPEDIFPGKTAASQINYWQPLGTLYVAASLKKAGHEVLFLNGAFLSEKEIIEQSIAFNAEFAGIYSTTFGWPKALLTTWKLRQKNKSLFITVGGPYPIAMQEKCLKDSEAIDAVVTGEGEYAVVELVNMLENKGSLHCISGLYFREKGQIVQNKDRDFITELDEVPFPARELLGDFEKYIPPPATYKRKPVAVVMTSRGCNRNCLYCFQIDRKREKGIRYRSVANVMDEVELCLQQGYKEIKFIDDTFAADYKRAEEIAGEILKRKLDFSWFASACVNQVDLPLLQLFKKAGCWAILLGAESGVQKDLNTIRKGITTAQIEQSVKNAQKAGLKVFTPFLFGIPGQTYEDALESIDFACRLNPDVANFHALTPFPGTDLYDEHQKYGTLSSNLQHYTYQGAAFVPHTLTREQIAGLRQLAFRRFYSRPSYLFRRLLALRSYTDLKAAYTGFTSLIRLWTEKNLFRREVSQLKS